MYRSLSIKSASLAALGLFLAVAPAATAGLLGTRYVSVSYDHTLVESSAYDDGVGVSLFYNHPLFDQLDLGLDLRHTSRDGDRFDVGDFSSDRIQLVATAFQSEEKDNIFVRVGFGVGHVDRGDRDVTSFAWSGIIGTEYAFNEKALIQPYAGWSDVTNDGDTIDFIYGVLAVYSAADSFGLTARVEGDHRFNVTFSIGGLIRF